jgi:hypothetical protein
LERSTPCRHSSTSGKGTCSFLLQTSFKSKLKEKWRDRKKKQLSRKRRRAFGSKQRETCIILMRRPKELKDIKLFLNSILLRRGRNKDSKLMTLKKSSLSMKMMINLKKASTTSQSKERRSGDFGELNHL